MRKIKSIETIMFLAFMLLLIPMTLYLVQTSRRYMEDTVVENSMEYTIQLLEQVNQEVDSYIEYMNSISSMIMLNPDVIEYLQVDFDQEEQRGKLREKIAKQFGTVLVVREDIANLAVCNQAGRIFLNTGSTEVNPNIRIPEMEWYKKAMEAGGDVVILSTHIQNIVSGEYQWVITLSRMIRDPDTGENIGALMVDLNYKVIHDLCQKINLGKKGYVYLLDEKGNVIYHPKQQMLNYGLIYEPSADLMESAERTLTRTVSGEERIYMKARSKVSGWTAVGAMNVSELFPSEAESSRFYFITMLILIYLGLLTSHLLSKRISKPIRELRDSMQEVEKGNFLKKIGNTDETEIGMLGRAYNVMIDKIQDLMQEQVRQQRQKRKNELRALQAQINPHFLYNTLDSIIWLAEEERSDDVVTMTVALSRLFRQNIHNQEEEVSVRQAVEYVKNYLVIQKMRYGEQLRFEIQVDEAVMDYYMIRLLLQPLVENAIYHGIKSRKEGGTLRLTGCEDGDRLIFEICDDGMGMSQEQLEHIFEQKPEGRGNGVGIRNVQERLQLHYGAEYGLQYESVIGRGTCVRVIIPKRNEVEQE